MKYLIVAAVSCVLLRPAVAFAQHDEHSALSPDLIGSASVKPGPRARRR